MGDTETGIDPALDIDRFLQALDGEHGCGADLQ